MTSNHLKRTVQGLPPKCLILAAGRGDRLSGEGVPKPLLPLAGLPLIERTILTVVQAGIHDFFVVTGYKREEVEAFLSGLCLRKELKITFIHNDEWDTGENGLSVLKAENFFQDCFILLMVDHIFDEKTLTDLLNQPLVKDGIILATDFKLRENKLIDIDDVTKVSAGSGKIQDIGKDLTEYNAYDTGMFLCTSTIFQAIKESCRNGDTSLSGGVKLIARKGNAKVFDIKDRFWMDIDTAQDRRKAKKYLLSHLTKPHDGWISRKINRKVSTRIFTPLLLYFFRKITPNAVSIISFAVGVAASLCFFFSQAIAGGIVLQLASILDGSDGEIARLKKAQSPFGNFFDAVLDRYADSFILFGMFYYSWSSGSIAYLLGAFAVPIILITSVFALTGNIMVSYTSAKSVTDFNYRYQGKWIAAGRGRDLRLFVLFLGGVFSFIHPISVLIALLFIALLSNAIVLKRILLSRKYVIRREALIKRDIKAVIFDFDGTLADTMPFLTSAATELITANYDMSEEEARSRYLETTGLDFASQMELIFPHHPGNKDVITSFEKRKCISVLNHPLFPDTIPALKSLRVRNITCFVCSSTIQEIITEYCLSKGIEELVDGCYGLKERSGKGNQIDSILDENNLLPSEVLFVGDSLRDGELAERKKIQFIGISRIFNRIEFRKKGLRSVDNLTDLLRLFEESQRFNDSIDMSNY